MVSEDMPSSDLDEERELAALAQRMLDVELGGQDLTPADDMAELRKWFEYWERSFGDKVKQWRRARNWSQDELADRLRTYGFDMHQTTVAKIERGTRPLRVAEAAAIAAIFRVPPLAVFLGPPPERMPMALSQMHETLVTYQDHLEFLREQMETSASLYAEQQAKVAGLAGIYNEAALEAEHRHAKGTDSGSDDDAEA